METWITFIYFGTFFIFLMQIGLFYLILDIRTGVKLLRIKQDWPQIGYQPEDKRSRRMANNKASSDRMKAFWAEIKKKG